MNSVNLAESGLKIYSATTFLLRLRGLLGRRELETNEALHIKPCSDVHTFGMKYELDVVFLDRKGAVMRIDTLAPNRWSVCRGAHSVLEFKAGCALLNGYKVSRGHLESADVKKQEFYTKTTIRSIGERV